MSKYRYLESKLADGLGLSQATIRKGRRLFLEEGADFGRIQHESRQRVAYTKEAAARIISSMAQSPEIGIRATRTLKQADIALVMDSAIVREAGASEQEKTVDIANTQPPCLLEAPWEVPPAVLVVVRITKNRRIIEAVLHPDWVRENGFEYYYRVLLPLLREHETTDQNLFQNKFMRVRVKDSRNFTKGMELNAAWVQQDLWECTQRMPRYRGRW